MSWRYSLHELADMMQMPRLSAVEDRAATGVSTDTRTLRQGDLFFALSGENFDANQFVEQAFEKGAVAVVASGAHAGRPCFQTETPLAALQRLAAAHRLRQSARVIAFTGSCGKTTAKDMTAAVLGGEPDVVKTLGNLNNDIGCPLSLMRMDSACKYAVIEMGANHMGEIAQLCEIAQPNETAVTIVAPAHLEGFGSVENVARAKGEIMEALRGQGCFYVNMDNPWCRAMGEAHRGEKVCFGSEGDVRLESLFFDDAGEMVLDIAPVGRLRLPLKVRAHATNVLLAVAVGLRHGKTEFEAPLREACRTAARFKSLDHSGVAILDDTYNANPASMAAALEALRDHPGQRRIAVLGDMFEMGDAAASLHYELGATAARCGVDAVIARGALADEVVRGARDQGLSEAWHVEEAGAAAAWLRERTRPGDVVLVKGSRGMKMETVIAAFRALAPGQG